MIQKIIWLLGVSTLLSSCHQPHSRNFLPSYFSGELSADQELMASMILLAQDSEKKLDYIYLNEGETEDQLSEWVDVKQDGDQLFHQMVVLNIYQNTRGAIEYDVQDLYLNLKDSLNRQPVAEYQFRIEKDTAFFSRKNLWEFRYTGESILLDEKSYFLLEGYAHQGDMQPGNYKWWNPELGTVLIWYGESRFLQMNAPKRFPPEHLENLTNYFLQSAE